MVLHKKKTSGQMSQCLQSEKRKWNYQRMSIAGRLVGKFSGESEAVKFRQAEAKRREFVLYP